MQTTDEITNEERDRRNVEILRQHGIEIVMTRDFRAPLVADDPGMDCGWQNIPLPPAFGEWWVIVDSRSDRKTSWARQEDIDRLPSSIQAELGL